MPSGAADLMFVGDSITARGVWNELFPDLSSYNRGIEGDTVGGLGTRLQELGRHRVGKLFLLIGINDLRNGMPALGLRREYRQMLAQLRSALPDTTIHVQSVLPVEDSRIDPREFNAELAGIVAATGATFVDLHRAFTTETGRLAPRYSFDGLHLNGAGYLRWRDEIAGFVR